MSRFESIRAGLNTRRRFIRFNLLGNQNGTAAVEFAIVAPVFLLMILGMLAFGVYLGAAHSLGQLTTDVARATIPGVTGAERQSIATSFGSMNVDKYAFINIEFLKVDVNVKKAHLVSAPGISIYAEAHAGTEAAVAQTLDFTWIDITNGAVKTTYTEGAVDLLVENLVEDLTFEAKVPGLGLSSASLTDGAIADALEVLTTPVGDVVDQLLIALGVSLGEGDFRVNGAKCDYAVLVQ